MKSKTNIYLTIITFISVFWGATLYANEEASIFERVRNVDDPELAKLIEIAIENLPESKLVGRNSEKQKIYEAEVAKSKVIRVVTEKYAQIKLLDKKINEIAKKAKSIQNDKKINSELIIVKASLETERLSNIAQLREALHLVPWSPFGYKEINELNTWIHIDLFGDTARIYNLRKIFRPITRHNRTANTITCDPSDVTKHLEVFLKQKRALPIRITFAATDSAFNLAQELKEKIVKTVKQNNAEFKTDLSREIKKIGGETLEKIELEHTNEGNFFDRFKRPKKAYPSEVHISLIKDRLQRPFSIPMTIGIYDFKDNSEEGKKLKSKINKMLNELQLKEWVTIKLITSSNKSK